MTNKDQNTLDFCTIAARAGVGTDPTHGAVTPPLYLSSNFEFEEFGKARPYDYTRSGNPTRDALGRTIADLEGGYNAVITSSGMAALDLVLQLLTPDDLVIAPHDCYGGTYRLLTAREKKGHFKIAFANLTLKQNFPLIFCAKPKLVLVETPSNPLLRVTDIAAVVTEAKKHRTIIAIDNTFLSPVLQKPLDLGADIVIHSTTKYLNGHSDVVGGAVVSKTKDLHDHFAWWANCLGTTGAPFDAFLTLRGLRTLPARIRQQSETAQEIANYLSRHPNVRKTYYPGLRDHEGHQIARIQHKGYGAMVSFEIEGGEDAAKDFIKSLSFFSFAESLGGFESLVAHPATMTHAAMDETARTKAGISRGLIRLSIGLESSRDLLRDLERALQPASSRQEPTAPAGRRLSVVS